jgi:hypothetical protein
MSLANAQKTHCPAGHPYDETNTRVSRGRRVCRLCEQHRHDGARRECSLCGRPKDPGRGQRLCAECKLTDWATRYRHSAKGTRTIRASGRQRARTRRARLDAIKLEHGCADCGYREHPAALEFDHRDPATKAFNIAQSASRSWAATVAEIAKCDVRCANCHRVRSIIEGHIGSKPREIAA